MPGIFFFIYVFSREVFNKWQAQRWWADNYDKVMELYNVQRFNRQAVPLPAPPRSEDEVSLHPVVATWLPHIFVRGSIFVYNGAVMLLIRCGAVVDTSLDLL